MSLFLLIAAPFIAVAPGVFQGRSATPKMLCVVAGLALMGGGLKRKSAAAVPLLVFLAICCLSWIFAFDRWVGFAGSPRAPYYGVIGVSLVVLAYLSSSEIEDKDAVLWLIEMCGAVMGAFAVVQYLAGSTLIGTTMYDGRASGLRGTPVLFAASLVPCFLAAWHRERRERPMHPLPMFFIAMGMCAAQAKGALLASAVGVLVYEIKGAARGFGAAIAWLAVHLYILKSPGELERVELGRIAWTSFKQHPLLGWGTDNFIYAMAANRTAAYDAIAAGNTQASAHWDLAQVAATLGIAGVVAYLWTLWSLAKAEWTDGVGPAVLAAMFIQAQVNPIPTDVLVVVAVILGSRQHHRGTISIPEWVGPLLVGIALTLALKDLTLAARTFH